MRIVYLGAGAGGMYCGSCLHDNTLVAALIAQGADALLVPTYTPLRVDEEPQSQGRIFFGGINVYLQQLSPLFRKTPWFVDRWLDSPGLINWLTRRAGATDPADLGELTVSMLRGAEGNQRKELDKLVTWLAAEARPDVVHLSNAMLLGMAGAIRHQLGVPVVATLSGEDIFLDKLREPHRSRARDELQKRAADAAAFVALNRYYADYMQDYLQVPAEKIAVVPHGLKLAGHAPRAPHPGGAQPVKIGYLARICPDKGLHALVDAFLLLAQRADLPPLRLRVAGYLGPGDRAYFEAQRQRIAAAGLADQFDFVGEVDRAGKIAFLQSLDVMSVPTVYRESKGLSILEAWANAVPVVVPDHGTFPELLRDTGGGLLSRAGDVPSLADCIAELVLDLPRAHALGLQAAAAVRDRYTAPAMALRTLEVYRRLVAGEPGPAGVSATALGGG
ncbi:MAG: glycosyltransferase family 4 protein [Pirellulales bacterium]|nr:glycosyltransferase family 4 protein [Pirellulales bacterium]